DSFPSCSRSSLSSEQFWWRTRRLRRHSGPCGKSCDWWWSRAVRLPWLHYCPAPIGQRRTNGSRSSFAAPIRPPSTSISEWLGAIGCVRQTAPASSGPTRGGDHVQSDQSRQTPLHGRRGDRSLGRCGSSRRGLSDTGISPECSPAQYDHGLAKG